MGIEPQLIDALLHDGGNKDRSRDQRLFELLYPELRRIAGQLMRHERKGHSLPPTAVVHEAYLKLVEGSSPSPGTRTRFYAAATRCMRQLLTDHARGRGREKRGRGWDRITLSEVSIWDGPRDLDLDEIDCALEELAQMDTRKADIVTMRFFGEMAQPEIAASLGISESTVEREWRVSRAWLVHRLRMVAP